MIRRPIWKRHALRAGGTLLLLVLLAALYSLGTARQSHAGDRADIAVTLRSLPNLEVQPGSAVTYEVIVRNLGKGEAGRVRVVIPYDPVLLSGIDAQLNHERDWVSQLTPNVLELRFADVGENERRTATFRAQLSDSVAPGTVLTLRAVYEWYDVEKTTSDKHSNAVPILVGSRNQSSANIVLAAWPDRGPVGTVHTFSTNRFAPGERISAWLNTASGPVELTVDLHADREGHVQVAISTQSLPPGSYSLVLAGTRSDLTAVGAFIVDNPAAPATP